MAILRWFSAVLLCSVAVALAGDNPSILDICGQGVGIGYDVVNERFKFPLVAWHYELDQTDTLNGVRYQIPDELFFARTPQLLADSSFQVMKSTSQFIQSYISTTKFGASATLLKGKIKLEGALSKTKGDVTKILNENNSNFATVNNDFLTFRLNMYPIDEVSLHPRFKAEIDKLPSEYNAEAYMSLIDRYGTHFFVDNQYGGRNNFTTSFDSKLFSKHDSQWVTDQLSFNLGMQLFKFNVSSTLTSNNTKVTSEFLQESNTTHIVLGGDPTVFEIDGYQKWLPTIAKQHALIPVRSQLAPISDLIKDATKKTNFDQAIVDYCNNPRYRPATAIVDV